jgi:hypothetical protein
MAHGTASDAHEMGLADIAAIELEAKRVVVRRVGVSARRAREAFSSVSVEVAAGSTVAEML